MTADSVYGADHALRRRLQEQRLGYVLAVARAQRLGLGRVEAQIDQLPAAAWHRLSAGDGAKGPRLCDWAYLPYGGDAAPGWEKGILIRRSVAQPDELAFYLTHATDGTALADLVRIAGTRWTIEAGFPPRTGLRPAGDPGFEAAKGEVGLDQYEVGSWTGWHRHVTLGMLAHAYLAALRKVAVGGRAHARPGGRVAPAHRPGAAPPPLAPRPTCPTPRPCSHGRGGDAVTSNAPAATTGSAVLALKPGCSTRLQGADLSMAQLARADLTGAQLSGVLLWGAQLQGAILNSINLVAADLTANAKGCTGQFPTNIHQAKFSLESDLL